MGRARHVKGLFNLYMNDVHAVKKLAGKEDGDAHTALKNQIVEANLGLVVDIAFK